MYIFSDFVTDDLNCWFAVKPDICNLKTHARLHDCTCLQTSHHEDVLLKKQCYVHTAPGRLHT